MGQIEWAMWANEQAVVSGVCLLMGSIVGVAGQFKNWQFAAFAIVASFVILFLEWPRSKRKKGTTIERKFQIYLTKAVNKMTPATSNYYGRFVFHLMMSVPCCFLLPTIMGGMGLMIAALIYLVAAVKGEQWIPAGLDSLEQDVPLAGASALAPPTRPPPRGPNVQSQMENVL